MSLLDKVNQSELQRDEVLALALDMDRLMRRFHIDTRPSAIIADQARIGPFGGMILMAVADMGPVPIQALGQHLARDKGQMTRALQLLERKNLLERIPSTEDRRVSLVQLTEEGRNLVADFSDILATVVTSLLSGLSPQERRQFASTIAKVLATQD